MAAVYSLHTFCKDLVKELDRVSEHTPTTIVTWLQEKIRRLYVRSDLWKVVTRLLADRHPLIKDDKLQATTTGPEYFARLQALKAMPAITHTLLIHQTIVNALRPFAPESRLIKSNRARRAPDARMILSSFAGISSIDDGEASASASASVFTEWLHVKDVHGNLTHARYDLCQDGQFDGMDVSIVVCDLCSEGRDKRRVVWDALSAKGFKVQVFSRERYSPSLTPNVFDHASQIWVISDKTPTLADREIDGIVKAHCDGAGLYIFGDNDPYFADANRILERLGLPLMSGNQRGCKRVRLGDATRKTPGVFQQDHLLTTGIVSLYEGETVAYFPESLVSSHGFEPILRESTDGELVVAYRPAQGSFGPIIVDTAFTKLYCSFDDVSSRRLVINFAIALGVDLSKGLTLDVDSSVSSGDAMDWDFTDALVGECSILCTDGPIVMLMESAEVAVTDSVINNPLGLAYKFLPYFSSQIVGQDTFRQLIDTKTNPFTRKPLEFAIPAVSLASEHNRELFENLLCHVFLQGVQLPRTAWQLFLGAVVLYRHEHGTSEILDFWLDQVLRHVLIPDGLHSDSAKVPVVHGLTTLLQEIRPDDLRLISTYTTSMKVLQAAHALAFDEIMLPMEISKNTKERAFECMIGMLVNDFKSRRREYGEDRLAEEIRSKLRTRLHGVSVQGEDVPIVWEDLVLANFRGYMECFMDWYGVTISTELATMIGTLVVENVFSWGVTSTTAEILELWNCFESVDVDAIRIANARWVRFDRIPLDVDDGSIPMFVTTYGPSVFQMSWGPRVMDPLEWPDEPSTDQLLDLLKRRNEVLTSRYTHLRPTHHKNTQMSDWVVAAGGVAPPRKMLAKWKRPFHSIICNVHRHVQFVMEQDEWRETVEYSDELLQAVICQLKTHQVGNIHDRVTLEQLPDLIKSFLECRKRDNLHLVVSKAHWQAPWDVRVAKEVAVWKAMSKKDV